MLPAALCGRNGSLVRPAWPKQQTAHQVEMARFETTQHEWNVTPKEAILVQERLRNQVVTEDRFSRLLRIGGVDVHFDRSGSRAQAAVVVMSFPGLRLIERAVARTRVYFPYLPGLLSFRELPPVIAAMSMLKTLPDLLICDGQGFAHPRRFGMACHLGVVTDIPSIGAAKTRLLGIYPELPEERGAWVPMTDRAEVVGAVLRTRTGVKPLFVSVGHRISLPTAVGIVLDCTPRYRLPETTRLADRLARQGTEEGLQANSTAV
jgi:deoxyribonuclease V